MFSLSDFGAGAAAIAATAAARDIESLGGEFERGGEARPISASGETEL
jgi:hypothetical protein